MGAKHPNSGADILDVNQQAFEGQVLTAGNNYSEWMALGDADYFGAAVDVSSQTGSLDVQAEVRFGGAASVYTCPAAENSETQAALAAISSDGDGLRFWKNFLPSSGQVGEVRFNFNVTTGPVTIDQAVIIKVGA